MKLHSLRSIAVSACALGLLAAPAMAAERLNIKPLAEKKVTELPKGELYWRIENFGTAEQAQAAASPWSLVAEADGKVWLFTLGPAGGSSANGHKVAEVGPIKRIAAAQYLLRINEATGAPGSATPVHNHPGSEAFFVLQGEQSIRGPHGTQRVEAGHPEPGQSPGQAMQVSSTGSTALRSLVMFVVDAGKPFSSPAKLP